MGTTTNLKDFVLEHFDTNKDEFWRCFVMSNTIVYRDGMVMMMNDEWIFYHGAIPKKQKTKEFYNFHKSFDIKGKKFCSKDPSMYRSLIKNGIIEQVFKEKDQ